MFDPLNPRTRELLAEIEQAGSLPALAVACEAHAQRTLFRLAFEAARACWQRASQVQVGVEPAIIAARFAAAEAFLAGEKVESDALARFIPYQAGTPAERQWLSHNSHVVQPLSCLLGALRTGNRHAANLAIADAARWMSEEQLFESLASKIVEWASRGQ